MQDCLHQALVVANPFVKQGDSSVLIKAGAMTPWASCRNAMTAYQYLDPPAAQTKYN